MVRPPGTPDPIFDLQLIANTTIYNQRTLGLQNRQPRKTVTPENRLSSRYDFRLSRSRFTPSSILDAYKLLLQARQQITN